MLTDQLLERHHTVQTDQLLEGRLTWNGSILTCLGASPVVSSVYFEYFAVLMLGSSPWLSSSLVVQAIVKAKRFEQHSPIFIV